YNILMLGSLVACTVFLFLILRELKLPVWYAVFVAIIIAFLSPQMFRIRAHYALGYAFFIPMFWYFLIRIFRNPKALKWYVIYAVSGLLAVLVLPSYALMHLRVLAAQLLVVYFQEEKIREISCRLFLGLVAAVIVPLRVFEVYMNRTDAVIDR